MNIWLIAGIMFAVAFIAGFLVGYLPNRVIRTKV
jgi:ABC-type antimicrobial peptide transport system permease subunit